MKRVLILAVVSFALAAVVILTVVPVAQSAVYSTTYYNIYYYNSSQYRWARSLAPYLGRAFWAAKTTIGWDARLGKMKIYFVYRNNGASGWMYGGYQNIYLNSKYFRSWDKWGSVVAHESAHVLFYNVTRAHLWNGKLVYYRTFLTESLSWYAGDYVYNYFRYTRASAFSWIRQNLQYYFARTGYTMSWTDSGYFYRNGSGNYLNQAIWSLAASGWFLTDGRLTTSSGNVRKLLGFMRRLSSANGLYLRSGNYGRALGYFEYAFFYAYGRYANAGWIYTGSANQAYKNTSYLYGSFWYLFYPTSLLGSTL